MKNKRAFQYSLNSKAFVIGAVIIVLLLNAILISLNDKISLEIDFTNDAIFTLTGESKAIAGKFDTPVEILMLTTGEDSETLTMVKNLLDQYTQANSKISVREVDYVKNPTEVQAYIQEFGNVPVGSLIIKYGDNHEVVSSNDYFSQDGYSYIERAVTTKLAALLDGMEFSSVLFVNGHGEQVSSSARKILEMTGYEIGQLDTLTEEFPRDSESIIIISAPKTDFSIAEIEKLDAYLSIGGNVQIYFDPVYSGTEPLTNLETYLKDDWGIIRGFDVVLDPANMIENSNFMVAEISDHEIIAPVAESRKRVGYGPANSLTFVPEMPVAVEATSLLTTGKGAYAKELSALKQSNLQKASGDAEGPFSVLVMAAREIVNVNNERSVGNLMVSGSVLMFDTLTTDTRFANEDLLLNVVSWMKGGETGVTVRAKQLPGGKMVLSVPQFWTWLIVLALVIPLIILAAGIVVFMKRRYK